jgi:hypothetical protein
MEQDMKKIVLAGVALGAFASASVSAHPQQGPQGARELSRAELEARVDAAFVRLDSDRDGYITRAEAEAGAGAFRANRQQRFRGRGEGAFARIDTNRDGVISRDEFEARAAMRRGGQRGQGMGRRGPAGPRGVGLFARLAGRHFDLADTNRDGRVSRAEASAAARITFDRVDSNRDGTVTFEERRAARAALGAGAGFRRRG